MFWVTLVDARLERAAAKGSRRDGSSQRQERMNLSKHLFRADVGRPDPRWRSRLRSAIPSADSRIYLIASRRLESLN
jgi:hypothetical protein